MIELDSVTKRFGDLVALDDISVTFNPGETTVILGPSGSGKSTLLRCLNLLEVPQSGHLRVADLDVDFARGCGRSITAKVRRHSAMVFQSFQLFPHLRVLDNITLGPIANGHLSKEQATALASDLLAKVGLADRGRAFPAQLSGGQQQRVAIARALAMQADFLLCDEPTSALDPELEAEVINVLDELAHESRSLIVVTHNMGFARQTADRILFLEAGRIEFDGSPDAFFAAPTERIARFLTLFHAA